MRPSSVLIAAAIIVSTGASVLGQIPPAPTTVQLPTFHVFTVQTTVSVPDRGGLALGSISRGADGRVTLGPLGNRPFGNRSSGSNREAGGLSTTATIIDNRAIDEAILASGSVTAPNAATLKAAPLAAHLRSGANSPVAGSVAAIRQHNAEKAAQRNRELADLELKAQRAESAGKLSLARAYYQMIARQASGEMKQRAEACLVALSRPAGDVAKR